MKIKLINLWNQLFPYRRKRRNDVEDITNNVLVENVLPAGDNSPIKVFEDNEFKEVPHCEITSSNYIPEAPESIMEKMHDIDFVESEKPQKKQDGCAEKTAINENNSQLGQGVDSDKLVSLTIETIRYFDQLRCQMPSDDLKTMLDEVSRNLIDNLIISGCKPINEEPGTFNITRHQIVPFQMVTDGTPYQTIKRPGIEYKGEVKLLAIVEL